MEFNALLFEIISIDIVEATNICIALGLESGPVKLWFVYAAKLVPWGVMSYFILQVRGVPHNLADG
jgi:hypothetical protein